MANKVPARKVSPKPMVAFGCSRYRAGQQIRVLPFCLLIFCLCLMRLGKGWNFGRAKGRCWSGWKI